MLVYGAGVEGAGGGGRNFFSTAPHAPGDARPRASGPHEQAAGFFAAELAKEAPRPGPVQGNFPRGERRVEARVERVQPLSQFRSRAREPLRPAGVLALDLRKHVPSNAVAREGVVLVRLVLAE